MNNTNTSLLVAVIATSICFSLGFFSNVFIFNGSDFLLTYSVLTILFSLPMSKVAMYTDYAFPMIQSHSEITKKYANTDKFKAFSFILAFIIIIIMSIIFFDVTSYILDMFDNLSKFERLSHPEIIFDNNRIMYTIAIIVMAITVTACILAVKNKINIDRILNLASLFTILMIISLVIIVAYKTKYLDGLTLLFESNFNYKFTEMFAYATVYAILSNFISISIFKNIVKTKRNNVKNINIAAIKNATFTVFLTFIICVTIYALISSNTQELKSHTNLQTINIFTLLSKHTPKSYLTLEFTYLMFNFVSLLMAISYLVTISKKSKIRLLYLSVPFAITLSFIHGRLYFVDFTSLYAIHLLIILIFIFDVFIIGWLYDAQKLSYEMLKNSNTKVTPLFNISLRLIIPSICFFAAISYIFDSMNIYYIFAITLLIMIIYMIIGIFLKKMFGQRRY